MEIHPLEIELFRVDRHDRAESLSPLLPFQKHLKFKSIKRPQTKRSLSKDLTALKKK
jgi:hypothetical protein